MDDILTDMIGLLVAAIVVAQVARLLSLPYTVGLVFAGIALAVAHVDMAVHLTHDLVFDIILPPLLFEAAINIHWHELRRDLIPVVTLAILGTAVSAALVALGMIHFLAWPAPAAIIFGVLIAATDPVAVIAMFKDNGVTGRMRLLVESESLFNDGVAAVLFVLALAWTQISGGDAAAPDLSGILGQLARTVGGGLLIGAVAGAIGLAIAGRTADRLIEAALTAVVAYGSFLGAERLHDSGVLAAVVAGLIMGTRGILREGEGRVFSEHSREFLLSLWEFIAFLANSLVFLLIGIAVAGIEFGAATVALLLVVNLLVLAARAAAVYPLCLLFRRTRRAVEPREQHVLWWGGLRGALGLALALSLPASFAMRDQILLAAFGVVVFSVVVQGVTMPLLLRSLGFHRGGG
jgi:CPA1 family monovalent cation:H+ antiporter